MPIDSSKPVRLKKAVVDKKTGNYYPPLLNRAYEPGEIPLYLITDENCFQDDGEQVYTSPLVNSNGDRVIQPNVEYQDTVVETKPLVAKEPPQPVPTPAAKTKG